jgi:protein CpxP
MAPTEILPTFVQHKGNNAMRSFDHRQLGKPHTMTRQIRLLASVAAFAIAAAGASFVVAQDLPMQPAQAKHEAMMHDHMQAHARAMHDILAIRPDQEAAWQTFIASMVPPHHPDMDHHGEGHDADAMTTPERLDHMSAEMAEHQAAFQRHADAVRRFYAVLSPEQKKAFDALGGMMHGMGHGGMEHHGMGHPDMGMEHGDHDGPPPEH